MDTLRIFLMAALFLIVFGIDNVEGEHTFGQLPIQEFSQSGRALSTDISDDGKYVVIGTYNGITLYDREIESQIWNYGTGAAAVSISPNGEYIAGGNEDEIYLFERASSYPLWSYEFSYDYYDYGSDSVMSLEFSDNGETLILSSSYNISLFDVSDGDLVWHHSTGFFYSGIYDYDVSADGQYVAVCDGNGGPIVYDSQFVGNDNYSLSYNSIGDCNSVAISPNGDYIVTVSTQQLSELIDEYDMIYRREDTAHLNFYSRDNNNTFKTIELDKEVYDDEEYGSWSDEFCRPINSYGANPTCYESDLVFTEDGRHLVLAFNKMYGENEYEEEEECDENGDCTVSRDWPNMSFSLRHFEDDMTDLSCTHPTACDEGWVYELEDDNDCAYPRILLSDENLDILYSCGSTYEWSTFFFFDDGDDYILKPPRWLASYGIPDSNMLLGDIKPIGRWNSVSMSADGELAAAIEDVYSGTVAIYDNSLPKPDLGIMNQRNILDIYYLNLSNEYECCLSNEEPLGGNNITLSVGIWMFDCCHRALDSHFIVSFYYSDYDYPENLYLIGNVTIDKGMMMISSTWNQEFMEPSSSEYYVSVNWTNIPVGNFNLYVVADSTNLIDEQDSYQAYPPFEQYGSNNVLASEWDPEWIGYGGLTIWERPIAIAGNDVTVNRGETVQFAGMGSADDRLNIVKYQWDFDADGFYEYESDKDGITTFIYNEEGKHTAIFKITDDGGFEAIDSRIITVKATDYQEKEKCVDGETKIAEDGCNQCVCNNEEWLCTEVACNPDDTDEDGDDDESSLPSVSMIPVLISIGLIAIFRRK